MAYRYFHPFEPGPHAPEAEAIVKSLFQLCWKNITLDMSNGNMNPLTLDTGIVTNELLDAAVKANADPTRLVEIAKKLAHFYGYQMFSNRDIPVDDRKCWRIPYFIYTDQMVQREEQADGEKTQHIEGVQLTANIGHFAWIPRRPRLAGGHTQFDTRITFGPKMDAYTACKLNDTCHLKEFQPHLFNAIQSLHPGANNVAVLVKLFLGFHLAERYGDHDTIKGMVRVIDDSNRPVLVKFFDEASLRGTTVPPWQPYVYGAATGSHHIYAHHNFDKGLAHCLYLASVEWPFWPDVDFEQNLVPPQLAVKVEGIPGNNVIFVRDHLSKDDFGDKIRFPEHYFWHRAIQWFTVNEFAYEECCYAREIAARITFYWPEHAPESHHRDIAGLDAAALTTFFNGNLVLPLPVVGRSLIQRHCKPANTVHHDLWSVRMEAVLLMSRPEGIIYDNLVGRTIAYAQGCVAQRLCLSADYLLSVRADPGPLSPRFDAHVRHDARQMSIHEEMWYVVGSRIFNFMPSSKSIELCSEAVSRVRNAQNHHRLIDRPGHRLVSSSQVLDIMTVMPDACYLGIGNIALSNVASNLCRSDYMHPTDTFLPKMDRTSDIVQVDHGNARTLANFVRCLGISTVEDRPTYYVTHEHNGTSVDGWQPMQVIYDPVFIHMPEEATWTTFNDMKLRRCFKIQNSNTNSLMWPTLIGQCLGNNNKAIVPRTGRICVMMVCSSS